MDERKSVLQKRYFFPPLFRREINKVLLRNEASISHLLASHIAAVIAAIMSVFGPVHGKDAVSVSWCESRHSIHARNGQYRGLFQMGAWERRNYAHGRYRTARDQALAARRYFRATGRDWGAWSCRPTT